MEPEKQERILDAATELFARFGYRKTSIDQVAGQAGVGKGTVYLMCASKSDLFYQAVHREIRRWTALVSSRIDPRLPADQLLIQSSIDATRYIEDRPLVRDLLLGNYTEMLPVWTDEADGLKAIARRHVVEILHIGMRQGRFRTDLDVERVARMLQEMQAMGLLLSYREKRSLEEQLDFGAVCLDVLLRGLTRR